MNAILCSFSSGIGDMKRAQQGNVVKVLRVLKKCGRYSAFEASENDVIARMMTRLHHKGYSVIRDGKRVDYGKLIETTGGDFPWTKVRLTEGGERLLADNQDTQP